MADVPKVQSLDDSLRWLDRLEGASGVKAMGAWPMAAVLEHLAQSIEMSMDGYPQSRSALCAPDNRRGAPRTRSNRTRRRWSEGARRERMNKCDNVRDST